MSPAYKNFRGCKTNKVVFPPFPSPPNHLPSRISILQFPFQKKNTLDATPDIQPSSLTHPPSGWIRVPNSADSTSLKSFNIRANLGKVTHGISREKATPNKCEGNMYVLDLKKITWFDALTF